MLRERLHANGGHRRRCFLEVLAICLLLGAAGSCVTSPVTLPSKPPAAPPSFSAAVAAYSAGSYEASIDMLRRLIALDPNDRAAAWELARQLEEAGRYAEAASVLHELARFGPERARADEELFVDLYLAGDLEGAHTLLPLGLRTAHSLFYQALLFRDSGDPTRAAALLEESLALREWHPTAWYALGTLRYASREYARAEECFQRVLKQDPDQTMALVPLAESMLAQEKLDAAYALLRRAHAILPDNAWIDARIEELGRSHPRLVEKRAESRALSERTTMPPYVLTVEPAANAAPFIRVGLAEGLQSITLRTGGDFTIRSAAADGGLTYHGGAHQLLVVRSEDGVITLSEPGGSPFLSWSAPVTLSYDDPRCTTVIFDLELEKGSFYAKSENLAYRGSLELRPGHSGLTVVNVLPLEQYLYAVVPSEMPAYWPAEALKAQAVAARSYTLASLGRFAARGFDVQGSVISASYGGVNAEQPSTTGAVNATAGQVLLFDGKPLQAFYSANSGGYSEDSRVVWGQGAGMAAVPDVLTSGRTAALPLTALIGWLDQTPPSYSAVPGLYSRAAYRWSKWVPAEEIARRVAKVTNIGAVLSIVTRGRGVSGRVEAVEVTGTLGATEIRGDRIRSALGGLRSTLFTLRPQLAADGRPKYFIFTGGGWGHGVGMDQSGAAGMAAAGYSYREILAHYYPRASLGVDAPDATALAPTERTR